MSGIQGAAEAARQPIALQAEWTISTSPLEFAITAINTASMYFAGISHPVATGIGCFLALPDRSYRSMELQPEVCDSPEKIKHEIVRRENLISQLAWRTLLLAAVYLDAQYPEDGFSMGSIMALLAGGHFCRTVANAIVRPSAIYAKQEEQLPDIPLVTCTVRTEDGATVYEARS